MSPVSAQKKFQTISPPFRWDEAGGIRIGSSRVTLDSVLASYHNGCTPEEIAIQFWLSEICRGTSPHLVS